MDVEKVIDDLLSIKKLGADGSPAHIKIDNAIQTIRELQSNQCYLYSPCEYQNKDKELQEQNKWHLCSEELPNESGEYLCYVNYDGNKFYNIEEIDCDGFFKEWNLTSKVKVIAWRELPKFEGVE